MKQIRDLLEEIAQYIESAEKKLEIAGVVPKYAVGQMVWIMKGDKRSWYDFPIHREDDKLEDMFEETEIIRIIISKLRDSDTEGSAIPVKNPLVVSYAFSRYMYYQNILLEDKIYTTLQEACDKNHKLWNANKNKLKKEILREKAEKKERLERELKTLNDEKTN